ncbi:MAG: hypothetical protein U0575_07450 [Phycisphaerales bacterium]
MNKQTMTVAAVGLVSGAFGAAMVAAFSTRAAAQPAQAPGKPFIVQVAAAPGTTQTVGFGTSAALVGTLFRVWSDGSVDAAAYLVKPPIGPGQPAIDYHWPYMCTPAEVTPPSLCVESLGFIPSDLSSVADLNHDGIVNGADMGVLLGEWDGAARE